MQVTSVPNIHAGEIMPFRIALCFVLSTLLAPGHGAQAQDKPHILYITMDDLGWKDVGYHGGSIQTPNIDTLAQHGFRLEKFYVQPFSGQTRAAAMTGRYPMRYGFQTLSPQPFSTYGLPGDERILPRALKDAGYRTALIGKWHLGHAKPEYWPTERGFDFHYGSLMGEADYFKKTARDGTPDWRRNGKPIKEPGYATSLLGKEAINFIGKHDPRMPLFMHLSFSAPQAPYQAPREYLDRYQAIAEEPLRAYSAMITAVDEQIGKVMNALDARGMFANTLVVFHPNCGGALKLKFPAGDGDPRFDVSNNSHFKQGRGTYYEGAVRVGAIVFWPKRVNAGSTIEPVHATDLYPTLLKIAGVSLEQKKSIDGQDVWPVIAENAPSPRKEILLNMEDFRGGIVAGLWKLIVHGTFPNRTELYYLHGDPSEENDQAEANPEKVKELTKRLMEFAWEMTPSKYLEDLMSARKTSAPMYWGENPPRP